MPRFAHDKIYKRIVPASFDWARRASARFIRRAKVKAVRGENFDIVLRFCGQSELLRLIASHEVLYSPHPLYLRSMAFERSCNYNLLESELRKNSSLDSFKTVLQAGSIVENREIRNQISRDAFQSRIYEDKLRQSSDGQ